MMEYALKYAADGFSVFPVYEPVEMGVCSCMHGAADVLPNGDKHSKGKHPRTPNGCSDATTDVATIKEWWTKWPKASIGIATGKKSGLAVVDLHGPEGNDSGRRLRVRAAESGLTAKREKTC